MTNKTYSVPGISCGHCVNTIQMEVGEMDGVESVTASAETKMVDVVFNDKTNETAIKELMAEINFPVAE